VLRNSVHAELYHDLLETCEAMRMPLEGLHTETGAGVLEAALVASEALERRTARACSRPSPRCWPNAAG